ncbi:hypothetical protein CC78DRAFT_548936 [Lojkania enalia]|uniref:Uncharacterized protein n=1 Tax=Lojkania enalia TaxID=147567 RepID=A0A9P4K0X7_9PLEO|nr:hypothetical protein CC78DRAFT_548936 [Didymosphaeria enalia]
MNGTVTAPLGSLASGWKAFLDKTQCGNSAGADFIIVTGPTGVARKILIWVKHFCGNEYMVNVTIVTTKWDMKDDEIDGKPKRYATWSESDLLQSLLLHKAKTFHHGLIWDNDHWQKLFLKKRDEERALRAKRMIHKCYSDFSNDPLQIYNEIAHGRTISTTSTERWLKTGSVTRQSINLDSANRGLDIAEVPNATQKSSSDPPQISGREPEPQSSTSWTELLKGARP